MHKRIYALASLLTFAGIGLATASAAGASVAPYPTIEVSPPPNSGFGPPGVGTAADTVTPGSEVNFSAAIQTSAPNFGYTSGHVSISVATTDGLTVVNQGLGGGSCVDNGSANVPCLYSDAPTSGTDNVKGDDFHVIVPANTAPGVYPVTVTVDTPKTEGGPAATASKTFYLTVATCTVTIKPIPDQNGVLGASGSVQIQATSNFPGALLYSANGLPNSLMLNSSTGLISGTLTGPTGTSIVNIKVVNTAIKQGENREVCFATASFKFTVSLTAPTPTPSPSITTTSGGVPSGAPQTGGTTGSSSPLLPVGIFLAIFSLVTGTIVVTTGFKGI